MMLKKIKKTDEPIIDPDIPIIDSHHHLFDRPSLRYMLEDYLDDVKAGHNIVASVYVETQAFVKTDGPEMMRPIGEIEFANSIGEMTSSEVYGGCSVCAGIVGYADLRFGAKIGKLLDRCLEVAPERFRGIRQITIEHHNEAPFRYITHKPPVGIMESEGFRQGLRELAKRGLIFDAAVFHPQLSKLTAIVDEIPNLTFVLNHMGIAFGLDMNADEKSDVFRVWKSSIRDLAKRPNVICKIGGLGMPFWGFGFEDREGDIGYEELANKWQPFVESAIEAFGTDRCMMESNFPPDSRTCGFVSLWNALKHIVRNADDDEKAALFHGTATRIYKLDVTIVR